MTTTPTPDPERELLATLLDVCASSDHETASAAKRRALELYDDHRAALAASEARVADMRDVLEAIASPYVVDGKDHMADVTRARECLRRTASPEPKEPT